jgi:toxin ParE1/3/4
MSGYRVLPRARADLADIWAYTFSRWDRGQADRYIGDIHRAMARLADNPALGRRVRGIPSEFRAYRAGSHMIFYRMMRGELHVVRVLHQSMQYLRHLR